MIKQILPALACCVGLLGAPAIAAVAAVDVNKADEAELTSVKGIGPAMARRILEERGKQGAFADADDLAHRVKGLGPKSVARLQDEGLTFGKAPPSGAGKKDPAAAARKDHGGPVASAKGAGADKAARVDKAGSTTH